MFSKKDFNLGQAILSATIVLAAAAYFSCLLYVQIYLHQSGDFSRHAQLDTTSNSYTYL